MKKYRLQEVRQKSSRFYSLVIDPRVIVKMIDEHKAGEVQVGQRPWDEKRVRDISKYVAGKFKDDDNVKASGMIPNTPIINFKNKVIKKDNDGYFIELPSDKKEYRNFSNTIEIIDGQHRIRAFMSEYLDIAFSDDTAYEMIFSVHEKLSIKEKKELFMITNEMQVKVPPNLLRMFKRELDLLKKDEEVYDLVYSLSVEDFSPLKDRIIIGANKITKGYQESQISKILNKSKVFILLKGANFDREIMAKILSNYLSAWEVAKDVSFRDPGKETTTKISGIRYMVFLFPSIWNILKRRKKTATIENFTEIIEQIPDATEIEDVFSGENESLWFRGEGATIKLAQMHAEMLDHFELLITDDYDISEGL
jgi:DGQHR domain-containing protein